MRTLLYGMQSSGASLLTLVLGQAPQTIVIFDLWREALMPALGELEDETVVAKCIVTTRYDFESHLRSFQPDKTILVLRHPYHNYVALSRKRYACKSGSIEEKLEILESIFIKQDQFDVTLLYEDFVLRPAYSVNTLQQSGVPVEPWYYDFTRSMEEIVTYNIQQSRWCQENYGTRWGLGNIRGETLMRSLLFKYVSQRDKDYVETICPTLCAFFNEYYEQQISYLDSLKAILWNDILVRRSRQLGRRAKVNLSTAATFYSRRKIREAGIGKSLPVRLLEARKGRGEKKS